MKAVLHETIGGPEVLQYSDVPCRHRPGHAAAGRFRSLVRSTPTGRATHCCTA